MSRCRLLFITGGSRGSVLLEVLVATILVGILVVPLATALAGTVDGGRDARARIVAMEADGVRTEAARSWEWGPRVVEGWWRPGPILHLRLACLLGTEATALPRVGMWVDGWLVDEVVVADAGQGADGLAEEILFGPDLWTGLAGGELVVRVRSAEQPWGPPWRLAVPEAVASGPDVGPTMPDASQQPVVVAHRPVAGTSPLALSWGAEVFSSPPFGGGFVVITGAQGWGRATLDERSQWWWMDEGRSVDLYF